MKTMTFSIIFLSLFTISCGVFAKTQKWYHVEILVFENQDKEAQELWPKEPGRPSLSGAVPLAANPTGEFGQLPDNALLLHKAKKRLQNNYNVVLHKGWRQTLNNKAHAQKIHLLGGKPGYEVDGTVLLSLGRNIYLDADLLLHKTNNSYLKEQDFRLTESSRIKPHEMTYIDHPLYGILVMVVPEKPKTSGV